MATDTVAFLEAVVRGPAHLLGYSDGAVVALIAALQRLELARRLAMVAGVFHRDAMYRGIPHSELAVIPGTSHGLLVEKPALCNTILIDFLANDPAPTLAPIRRATAPPT